MPVRREDGFALPLALSILVIVGLLVAAAVGFATHNTDRASRDLRVVRAQAAADAGVETAIYRMNKAIVASQVQGVLGLPAELLATTKCLDLSLGQLQLIEPSAGWCPASTETEMIDGPGPAGGTWVPAEVTYTANLGINVGTAPDGSSELIERKIVSVGRVDDVTQRVMATAHLRLGTGGNLVAPFEQVGYVKCTTAVPEGGDPAVGC